MALYKKGSRKSYTTLLRSKFHVNYNKSLDQQFNQTLIVTIPGEETMYIIYKQIKKAK